MKNGVLVAMERIDNARECCLECACMHNSKTESFIVMANRNGLAQSNDNLFLCFAFLSATLCSAIVVIVVI